MHSEGNLNLAEAGCTLILDVLSLRALEREASGGDESSLGPGGDWAGFPDGATLTIDGGQNPGWMRWSGQVEISIWSRESEGCSRHMCGGAT